MLPSSIDARLAGFRDAFSILEHGHAKPLLCEVNVHGEWLTLAVLKALRTRKYAGVAYNTSAPFVRRKGRGHVGYMAQPVGFIPFPRRSAANLWTIQGLDRKSSRALQDCDVVLASMEGPDSEARAALLMDLPRVLGRVRRGATSALLLLHGAQGLCPSGHNETYVPVMGRYLDVTGTLPAVPCWEAQWEALAQRGDVLDGACSQAHGRRFCLGSLRTDSICNAAEPLLEPLLEPRGRLDDGGGEGGGEGGGGGGGGGRRGGGVGRGGGGALRWASGRRRAATAAAASASAAAAEGGAVAAASSTSGQAPWRAAWRVHRQPVKLLPGAGGFWQSQTSNFLRYYSLVPCQSAAVGSRSAAAQTAPAPTTAPTTESLSVPITSPSSTSTFTMPSSAPAARSKPTDRCRATATVESRAPAGARAPGAAAPALPDDDALCLTFKNAQLEVYVGGALSCDGARSFVAPAELVMPTVWAEKVSMAI